ncbi:tRNA (guanosine(18)-2'-O)-methyltransferase [Rubripirellula amarantea]|uniref:tRNA (Guanosine(18)-2'-O)-methyltransferase n=1 Tax=Rubripirellula amarantea TaxID=2527999 RepID=A0A5C5WV41_9BACT|nr:RNA methyltransferase [Rubripirellula amarantea]TWT53971.1 tRNA (guanosine(18)-2'-O)-methyltransferase [Rubripirellula amarantea]
MTHIFIDRLDDNRLLPYRNLQSQSLSNDITEHFIVEGRYCVEKLAQSQWPVQSVLVQRGREDEIASWFPGSVDVCVLSVEQIRSVVGFNFHRGVLACGVRPKTQPLNRIEVTDQDPPIAIAACGISDRDNLGNIIRTATAMGIDHLLCDRRCVDPLARRVIRVSMGNVFTQKHFTLNDPPSQLKDLATTDGFRTIATTLDDDSMPISDFQIDDRPMILMLGNESTGLDQDLQKAATDRVRIPMKLATDSLNVSVATAIFLYELTRLSATFKGLRFPQGR